MNVNGSNLELEQFRPSPQQKLTVGVKYQKADVCAAIKKNPYYLWFIAYFRSYFFPPVLTMDVDSDNEVPAGPSGGSKVL